MAKQSQSADPADFSHAKERGRQLKTAWFTLEVDMIGLGRPRIECRPATRHNPAYQNAVLRGNRRHRSKLRSGNIDTEFLDDTQLQDAEFIPKYCVVGWDETTVLDKSGNPVPFSVEDCERLFMAVLSFPRGQQAFDDFRNEVGDINSFYDSVDPDDLKDQAGN